MTKAVNELVKVSPVRVSVAELDAHAVADASAREGDTELEIHNVTVGETETVKDPPIIDSDECNDAVA